MHRLGLALLADVSLAAVLSAAQFMILFQIQLAFTADHALLYFGSPLGLLLGPALYVLCRRGKKSKHRLILDVVVAAAVLLLLSAMILSIGQGIPSFFEVLTWLVLLSPAVLEAVGLIVLEWLIRKGRSGT